MNTNKYSLHKTKTLEERIEESKKVYNKYPDKVCAYIERSETCKTINEIDKNKFLVPKDLNVAQLIHIIRKRLVIAPESALFFFVNNTIISGNMSMDEINNKYKNSDGFLYIKYSAENCFGKK